MIEIDRTEMNAMIETDRLILRRYRKEDLQDLYEYLSDETVVRFEPYLPMDLNEVKEDLDWRISTDEMIAVELKSNHKLERHLCIRHSERIDISEIRFFD